MSIIYVKIGLKYKNALVTIRSSFVSNVKCKWHFMTNALHYMHPKLHIVKANGLYGVIPHDLPKAMRVNHVVVYFLGEWRRVMYLRTLSVAVTSPRLFCSGCSKAVLNLVDFSLLQENKKEALFCSIELYMW